MKIAASGLLAAQSGSVASAGFQLMQELLARGHEVDFFSRPCFVPGDIFASQSSFRYVDCDTAGPGYVGTTLWGAGRLARSAVDIADRHAYMRGVTQRILTEQAARNYDVVLFLGQWAYGPVPGVPVVSWVQGPPGTDVRSVLRHRAAIKARCGTSEYARLRAYSLYRSSPLGQPSFTASDMVICGSKDSCRTLADTYGVRMERLRSLPYPVDLAQFCPGMRPVATASYRLLWVGRVVPRKRLDLFLDASRKLCDAGWNLSLDVIGGFPFARGLSSVLSEFPYPERLNYVAHREREQLPDVYRRATVLIQPSEEENFGSSVSEALACGTPVIVGPGNGTRDYVDAGGIMFDKYSSSSVAHALQMLLAGYDQREGDLRADARAAAERHFALDHVADGLESVLAEAIERATSQPRH